MSLQTIVSLAVGIRLMTLARRSRRFPELALSLVTLLMPALGYPSLMLAVGLEQLNLPGVVPVFFVVFQWLSELRLWKRREAGRPEDGVSNSKPTHHAHAEAEAVEVAR